MKKLFNQGQRTLIWAIGLSTLIIGTAQAEIKVVRIAQQGTITYLPLQVMANQKFLEKRAKENGLGDVQMEWKKLSGGSSQNDALISGSIDIASGGIPPFLTLWTKTRKSKMPMVGIISLSHIPVVLTTRNPNFKKLSDISEKDRIGLSAVKVSTQALLLQMEAARLYGKDKYDAFDKNTVTLSGADTLQIMLSGASDQLNSSFYGAPNYQQELATPGINKVTDSEEILGGPASIAMLYTTEEIYKSNPQMIKSLIQAFNDSVEFIDKNRTEAAEIFKKSANSTVSTDLVVKSFGEPIKSFNPAPRGFMKFANFMNQIGSLPEPPKSWKDLFIPEVHHLQGD